ncbi:Wzz/FepE/Etk N-terminal domain-containing protein [Devosia sp. 1566]|uniref:GumC family protein n=1 Tax=Devosia sp. 1566 TaxID=2499144 RepID=UPI0013E37C08|nr:Wzz/FepE/Etk N-terminal domain-containing protein [Devosia sp. 1566]
MRAFDSQIDLYQLLGIIWARRWAALLVLLVVPVLAYIAVSRVPRLYESSATILVEPRPNYFGAGQPASVSVPDRATISSNVQLLRSRDTLMDVVAQLGLAQQAEFNGGETGQAAFDAAVLALDERTLVTSELGTAIIWLKTRAHAPEVARQLALSIAETAIARRAQQGLDDARQALAWLESTIPELRQRVFQAEDAVAKFRIARGTIGDLPEGSMVGSQLSDMAGRRLAAEERSSSFRARAAVLRQRLALGGSLVGSTELAADARGRSLIQLRASLQGQLAQQASSLSFNHPNVLGSRAQIADVDAQLATAARHIADQMDRQAETEAALAAALAADQQILQQSVGGEERDSVALAALQRDAAAQRSVLERYLQQAEAARAQVDGGAAFPDMRLVSHPVVSSAPVSPKTGLVLLAVMITAGALVLTYLIVTSLVARRPAAG